MDVWFANTNMETKVVRRLHRMSRIKGTKCCWTDKETGKSLHKLFTGFGRIVEYADYQRKGFSPEYAFKMSEGQFVNGKLRGYGRVISGYDGSVDFGFFKDNNNLSIDGGASGESEEFYTSQVEKFIKENQFVIFTKSYCPYSRALMKLLNSHGLEGQYKEF